MANYVDCILTFKDISEETFNEIFDYIKESGTYFPSKDYNYRIISFENKWVVDIALLTSIHTNYKVDFNAFVREESYAFYGEIDFEKNTMLERGMTYEVATSIYELERIAEKAGIPFKDLKFNIYSAVEDRMKEVSEYYGLSDMIDDLLNFLNPIVTPLEDDTKRQIDA